MIFSYREIFIEIMFELTYILVLGKAETMQWYMYDKWGTVVFSFLILIDAFVLIVLFSVSWQTN